MLSELLSSIRTNDTGLSIRDGESKMGTQSTKWINRIAMTAAVGVAAVGTMFTGTGHSAAAESGPVPGFTPDGVNFIPAAGFDSPGDQVVSYLNGWNHSPDGVSNIQDTMVISPVIAMFTPDGVNQVERVGDPAVTRSQVLAYMNGGNFSPDGVSNIQDRAVVSPVIAMFTPDGVNMVEKVGDPIVARPQVLAYMNGGNFSPDGVSNIRDTTVVFEITNLAYYYAETGDPSYVG